MKSAPLIRRIADTGLILIFAVGIAAPFAGTFFGFDAGPGLDENRILAACPSIPRNVEAVKSFPAKFEAYFNDHFGFRGLFIRLHSSLQARLPGGAASARVIVGKDGWLFFKGLGTVDSYRRARPFSRKELDDWLRMFQARHDWLAAHGIAYYLFIAPDKHTIYPEHMPDYLTRVGSESRLDQLMDHLRTHSDIQVVDVRPALMSAKQKERIHHRTDTHWNDLGAFAAYRAVMACIAERFRDLAPLGPDAFARQDVGGPGGDLAGKLGLRESFNEVRPILTPLQPVAVDRSESGLFADHVVRNGRRPFATARRDGLGPSAVVFHDSFFDAMVDFFAPHFSRTAFYWQNDMDYDVIEHEHPDMVVQEIVERVLMDPPPLSPCETEGGATGPRSAQRPTSE